MPLRNVANGLARRVIDSLNEGASPTAIIHECEIACYAKAATGMIVCANDLYCRTFGDGSAPIGRMPDAYLDKRVLRIAKLSDQMILDGGARVLEFEHSSSATKHIDTHMHTVKVSLPGAGHPSFAVLGLTEILDGPLPSFRQLSSIVREKWKLFQEMPAKDQNCALELARTSKSGTIAKKLEVSTKTVENQRTRILKALDIKDIPELIRLLCRVQDAGLRTSASNTHYVTSFDGFRLLDSELATEHTF